MPRNDSNSSEDFVFINGPVDTLKSFHIVSADDYAKPPVEADSDFVTVDNNGLIISAMEDAPDAPNAPNAPVAPVTPVAPIDIKPTQPIEVFVKELVHLEGFGPFLLSCFPDTITQVLLLAPDSIKGQATVGEVGGQRNPVKPHAVLIKNAKLLLECFFHFKDLNPKFGRERTLYIVGKACKISLAKRRSLPSHVGDILHILKESRLMFLRAKDKKSIPVADDPDLRELAKLVDQYINYKWEEPKPRDIAARSPRWCDDPLFIDLWSGWRNRRSAAEGQRDTGKDDSITDHTEKVYLLTIAQPVPATPDQRQPRSPTPPSFPKPGSLWASLSMF